MILSIDSSFPIQPNISQSYCPSLSERVWHKMTSPGYLASFAIASSAVFFGASLPTSLVIGAGCFVAQRVFKEVISGGESLRPGVFIGAESLSQVVQGGLHSLTVPPVLHSIKKMEGSSNVQNVQICLKSILDYVQYFDYSGLNNKSLVAHYQKTAKNLQPGHVMALPCSYFNLGIGVSHAMTTVFQCQENGKFSVTIHNGGEGVKSYHFTKSDHSTTLYQTALEIEDVDLPQLLRFISDLAQLHALRKGNSVKKLYEELIPRLQGTFKPASTDRRLWAKGQTGTSCTGYSIRCLIKSLLTEEEYKKFKAIFFSDTVLNLRQGFQSKQVWKQTRFHAVLIKLLNIKLLGLPEEGISKEVVEVLAKDFEGLPSTLGRLSHLTDRLFWTIIFSPQVFINPRVLSNLFRENVGPSDDYRREAFNMFNPELSKLINVLRDADTQVIGRFPVEELSLALSHLYHQADQSRLTLDERQMLDKSFQELLTAKNKKCKDSSQAWKKYKNNFLEKLKIFQVAMAPYYKGKASELCQPLIKACELFREGKEKAAKDSIAKAYKTIKEHSDELTFEQLAELLLVKAEFFSMFSTTSLIPDNGSTLAFFAAMEATMELLKTKVPVKKRDMLPELDPSYVVDIFKSNSTRQIEGSVWEEDMQKKYAEYLKNQEDLASSKVLTPSYLKSTAVP